MTTRQKQIRAKQIREAYSNNEVAIARLRADAAKYRSHAAEKEARVEDLYATNTELSHELDALQRKD